MTEASPEVSTLTRVSLEGELNVQNARSHYQALLSALARAPRLELDLSRVTGLDTAGVQLLMLAKRDALAQGKALHLVGHSAPVLRVFELLELSAYFGDVQYIHAESPGGA